MSYWWLSFCDAELPEGSQFLGAVIVDATDIVDGAKKAHALGINPGGEVQGHSIDPSCDFIAARVIENKDRLLQKLEIEELFGEN